MKAMCFLIIEALPQVGSEAAAKYGCAHVACWVNTTNCDDARKSTRELISTTGWVEVRVVEEKTVSADSYDPDNPALEYFNQALTDREVCVFYTSPR